MGRKRQWAQFIVSVPFLFAILGWFGRFANNFIEPREGIVMIDPVLNMLPPTDVTWLTFSIIYPSIFFSLLINIKRPDKLAVFVQTYVVMVFFRSIAMWLVPLDPPAGIIVLKDPLVEFFSTDKPLTRDLFFSGHTSSMFILFLTLANRKTRPLLLAATVLVAFCVLLQHVHYTIDVFCAFFFTYGAYRVVWHFQKVAFGVEIQDALNGPLSRDRQSAWMKSGTSKES